MKLIAVWVIGFDPSERVFFFFGTKTVESAGLHLFGIRITVDGFQQSSSRVEGSSSTVEERSPIQSWFTFVNLKSS